MNDKYEALAREAIEKGRMLTEEQAERMSEDELVNMAEDGLVSCIASALKEMERETLEKCIKEVNSFFRLDPAIINEIVDSLRTLKTEAK